MNNQNYFQNYTLDVYDEYIMTFIVRYQAAKKDNDFVYHDKVPEFDSLPEVKGRDY